MRSVALVMRIFGMAPGPQKGPAAAAAATTGAVAGMLMYWTGTASLMLYPMADQKSGWASATTLPRRLLFTAAASAAGASVW